MILAGLLLCLLTLTAGAQVTPRTQGRHFIIAFPDTTDVFIAGNVGEVVDHASIIIFSSAPANVTISSGSFNRTVAVGPNASTVVPLTGPSGAGRIFFDRPGVPDATVFDVAADREIGLYCYFVTRNGSEGFAPLPVESWGKEYVAMGFEADTVYSIPFPPPDEDPTLIRSSAPAEILVLASENNTVVRFDPNPALDLPPGLQVTLQAGQGYLVQTRPGAIGGTIAGARLVADKPVGVICGNSRTSNIAPARLQMFTRNSIRNSLIEWLPPADAGGRTFRYLAVGLPIGPIVGFMEEVPAVIRMQAIAPGTTTVTVSSGGAFQVPQGATHDITLLSRPGAIVSVTTDKPMLALAATGIGIWNSDPSEGITGYLVRAPALAELVPVERWTRYARFHSPAYPPYLRHYVGIVANAPVHLDARPVRLEGDSAGGFLHALVEVGPGDHTITTDGGCARFSAIAYGHAQGYEEYIPPRAGREDAPRTASAGHPSIYRERVGISYAYPVLGEPATAGAPVRLAMGPGIDAVPGDSIAIPVDLVEGALRDLASLTFTVSYDDALMKPTGKELIEGTLPAGWRIEAYREGPGSLTLTLVPPPGGGTLGRGRLLNLRFTSFIRMADSVELASDEHVEVRAVVTASPSCSGVVVDPVGVHFKICGASFRGIERMPGGYALDGSHPNPFNPSTEIGFSIGAEGHTTLAVYDPLGRRVATILDDILPAGRHAIRWDASGFPSGLYRYRVISGEWSAWGTMVLAK